MFPTACINSVQSRPRGVPFVGPLDDYTTNLSGAWSVARRLLTSYEGALIRVRRSSDDAEQDIGYDASGNLDTAALASFVGANSAYVAKVYAQDGGGVDYVNATASTQPLLVSSGTLNTLNGVPALLFETSRNTFLALGSSVAAATWMTTAKLVSVMNYTGLITGTSYVLIGNSGGGAMFGSEVAGYAYFVDSVDQTSGLTPFGYDPHCFTITGGSLTQAWKWGSERDIPSRFFDGPAVEQVLYSSIPGARANIETVLMNLLGL